MRPSTVITPLPAFSGAAKAASRNFDGVVVVMVIPSGSISVFKILGNRGSARRRQLTFDGFRVMREALGDATRHLADIDFFLAGL